MRVHIESARLHNFLSFYSGVVPFDKGLTVIVGPNGSGKTSIFHALKFALGSNQRENRYSKWSDFIRHGALSAEVEIQVRVNGRSKRLLRKIDRDGIPRAYVDGKRVKAAELRLLSQSFGLDTDNPLVFMPQERINALRAMDPHEVRRLVEEGTGLDMLRDRILLQAAEVGHSKQRLENALTESKSVEREMELLQGDLVRLEKKRSLQSQLRDLEVEMRWATLDSLSSKIEKTKQDIETNESGMVQILEEQASIEKQIQEQEAAEAEYRNRIDGLQLELGRIDASIEQQERDLAKVEGDSKKRVAEIRTLEGELRKERDKAERLKENLSRISETVEQYLSKKDDLVVALESIEKERAQIREDLTAFAEWNARRAEAHGKYRALQVEIEGRDVMMRSVRERLQIEEAELQSLESEWSHVWDKMEGADERDLTARKSQIERKMTILNEERFRASSRTSQLQKEIEEINIKLSETSERIPHSVRSLKDMVAEHDLQSVTGPLIEVFSDAKSFATVIESILAGDMAYSFVSTEKSEFQLIQKLRDKAQAPSPVILVRDLSEPVRIDLPNQKGIEGWLWDLLQVDTETKHILQAALGDYVLVSSLRSAMRLAEQHSLCCVTKDGYVVVPDDHAIRSNPRSEPTGLISTTPLTSRLTEAERDLAASRKAVTQIIAEIDTLSTEREEILTLLSQITRWSSTWEQRRKLLKSIPELQERLVALDDELKALQGDLGKAERELRALDNTQPPERSRLIGQDSALKVRQRKVQNDLSGLERRIELAQKDEEQMRKDLKMALENMDMLSRQLKEVKAEIRAAKDAASQFLEQIETLRASKAQTKSDIASIKADLDRHLETSKELNQRLVELNITVKDRRLQVIQAKRMLTNMQYELDTILGELDGQERPATVRVIDDVREDVIRLRHVLDDYRDVSESVARTESQLKQRMAELGKRVSELSEELEEAESTIKDIRKQYLDGMNEALDRVQSEINSILGNVKFPGSIRFRLTQEDGEYGVQFKSRIKTEGYGELSAGSGGERSLIAIGLILALQRFNPAPVYVMDEVDTFLDATNTELVSALFHDASRRSQFILLTPAKSTHLLKNADKILGVVSPKGTEPSLIIESPPIKEE
ncbi:MAG: AAA family ATPase [Candidatus Thorarchaeota archaeon]